jgi:hypothetical protein
LSSREHLLSFPCNPKPVITARALSPEALAAGDGIGGVWIEVVAEGASLAHRLVAPTRSRCAILPRRLGGRP